MQSPSICRSVKVLFSATACLKDSYLLTVISDYSTSCRLFDLHRNHSTKCVICSFRYCHVQFEIKKDRTIQNVI